MKAKSKLKSYFCGEEKKCQNYALPLGHIQFACVTKIPRKKAIILKAFLRFSPGKKKNYLIKNSLCKRKRLSCIFGSLESKL